MDALSEIRAPAVKIERMPRMSSSQKTALLSSVSASSSSSSLLGDVLTVSDSLQRAILQQSLLTESGRRLNQEAAAGEGTLDEVSRLLEQMEQLTEEAREPDADTEALTEKMNSLAEEIDSLVERSGSEIFEVLTDAASELYDALSEKFGADTAEWYPLSVALGALIAGGEDVTLEDAADGLQELLAQLESGVSVDDAVADLTGGMFSSLLDFEAMYGMGMRQELLTMMVTADFESHLISESTLETELQQEQYAVQYRVPEDPGALNAELTRALHAMVKSEASLASSQTGETDTGEFEVISQSGTNVSYDKSSNTLTISGDGNAVISGKSENAAITLDTNGTVTLRDVKAGSIQSTSREAEIVTTGRISANTLTLPADAKLVISGRGSLNVDTLDAGTNAVLSITGGSVSVKENIGEDVHVQTAATASFAAASSSAAANYTVTNIQGKSVEPLDLAWNSFLKTVIAVTVDGKQTGMQLRESENLRLWLPKLNDSSGYPTYTVTLYGRDENGTPRTRTSYVRWNSLRNSFAEVEMYPNPFTVTGGEEDSDWTYEEDTQTLRILSAAVETISGGSGTDANGTPFSGRIAIGSKTGELSLTLDGVNCEVGMGRAFFTGHENRVTLTLGSGTRNVFTSGKGFAGITVGNGTELKIERDELTPENPDAGELISTGGNGGAGIGRDSGTNRDRIGRIVIDGGTVTAAGQGAAAGIGAGAFGYMGDIIINGGRVTANGGRNGGAGIGGALGAPVGNIIIRGGIIIAKAYYHAAAIGSGVQGECGNIEITGTAKILTASGGDAGMDIGASMFAGCGTVRIDDGIDIAGAAVTGTNISDTNSGTAGTPKYALSSGTLLVNRMKLDTIYDKRAAEGAINVAAHKISELRDACEKLSERLSQSVRDLSSTLDSGNTPLRDSAAAARELDSTKNSILSDSAEALRIHSEKVAENVLRLLS